VAESPVQNVSSSASLAVRSPEPQGVYPCSGWMVFKVGHLHMLCFNRFHSCKTTFDCERRAACSLVLPIRALVLMKDSAEEQSS